MTAIRCQSKSIRKKSCDLYRTLMIALLTKWPASIKVASDKTSRPCQTPRERSWRPRRTACRSWRSRGATASFGGDQVLASGGEDQVGRQQIWLVRPSDCRSVCFRTAIWRPDVTTKASLLHDQVGPGAVSAPSRSQSGPRPLRNTAVLLDRRPHIHADLELADGPWIIRQGILSRLSPKPSLLKCRMATRNEARLQSLLEWRTP
jgi:hypothetical protein